MLRRCPACREVLLTLRVGPLSRCDRCEHYVEPDGAVVPAREGRIRTALAEAGDEPRMVSELEGYLSHGGAVAVDELRELCERHRDRVRKAIDQLAWPEELELERVEATTGVYREPGQRALTRVVARQQSLAISKRTRSITIFVAFAAFSLAFGSLACLSSAEELRGELLTVFVVALTTSLLAMFFSANSGSPIRSLVLEDDRADLEVSLKTWAGARTVRVPIDRCRLTMTSSGEVDAARTCVGLESPELDESLVIVPGSGRAAAIRLEDAFRLSGAVPAKKWS